MAFNDKNCIIIAEVGQTHEGSLGIAHTFIDTVASVGVDAIKFQTHIAKAESSSSEPFRVKLKYPQDSSRYAYWQRMEFTLAQWKGLKEHAEEMGLTFLSSPFSLEAVELLEELDIQVWKVASGEIQNWPMVDKIGKTKKPILLSSGMSSWVELDETVEFLKKYHNDISILQCTSSYPCPLESIGLNLLGKMKDRYGLRVGLSDHSGVIYPSMAAVVLGAKIIEVHVTFDRRMFGFDAKASLTINELVELVKGIRIIEKIINNPVDKNDQAGKMLEIRKLFQKSIVLKNFMKAGSVITEKDLLYIKPGTGISPKYWLEVVGESVKKDLPAGHFLSFEDLADEA